MQLPPLFAQARSDIPSAPFYSLFHDEDFRKYTRGSAGSSLHAAPVLIPHLSEVSYALELCYNI